MAVAVVLAAVTVAVATEVVAAVVLEEDLVPVVDLEAGLVRAAGSAVDPIPADRVDFIIVPRADRVFGDRDFTVRTTAAVAAVSAELSVPSLRRSF